MSAIRRKRMDRLTTTIKRQWLREIVAGRKKVEYRQIKKYWTEKLSKVGTPFELRLINGMTRCAPEVIVRIDKVRRNWRHREYELHIGKVLRIRYWNRKLEQPDCWGGP